MNASIGFFAALCCSFGGCGPSDRLESPILTLSCREWIFGRDSITCGRQMPQGKCPEDKQMNDLPRLRRHFVY